MGGEERSAGWWLTSATSAATSSCCSAPVHHQENDQQHPRQRLQVQLRPGKGRICYGNSGDAGPGRGITGGEREKRSSTKEVH